MVLIFPEGTRTRSGEIAAFRPGFTALAVRSGAAILPVAVDGAFQAWPGGKPCRARAESASITALPISPPKSPAGMNANCWRKSNAACAIAWRS